MSTQSHTTTNSTPHTPNESHGKLLALAFGALGVVFGDIGTSPLYAINEIFFGHGGIKIQPENVYGCISLVLWAITLIVTIKYVLFVLRADNDGQGGVFSLYGLINQHKTKFVSVLMVLLMLSAGLLFGDGIITPAISVLSAVEGLKNITPALAPYIIGITILILTGLFSIQHKGTTKVGALFGPVLTIWFIVIAALGLSQIWQHPQILQAFNPLYGINFLRTTDFHRTLLILGSVMLTITGGEALYADLGHFGKKPIRLSWFAFVFPALILNYLGQGAFLLSGSQITSENIFYSMVPAWGLIPMVILATCATIIASQALISGVFSVTQQAIAVGVFPRLKITQTHQDHEGQIYIRFINWALFIGCILLVISFRSSTNLASAYGLAVSGDMLITSLAMMAVATHNWKWSPLKAGALFGSIAIIDASFLMANSLKFFEGGFVPFTIGVVLFIVMSTWKWGRKTTAAAYSKEQTMTIAELINLKKKTETTDHKVNRAVVFMVPKSLQTEKDNTPALWQFFWDRYGILPKDIIFLDVIPKKIPYIHQDRYDVHQFYKEPHHGSVVSVSVKFGFMEEPDVEAILEDLAAHHQIALDVHPSNWKIHVSQERLITSKKAGWFQKLKLGLFQLLRQNSQPFYYYYGLGNDVKLAMEVMPIKVD